MATYSRDLKKQMQRYIDAEYPASFEFQKMLQSTPAEIRYKLLMEVKGVKYSSSTGVFNAVHTRDLQGVKCMLDGMRAEQKFNIIKIADSDGCTALHAAVIEQDDHPCSSEVAKELANNLSTQQLYQLLEIKTKTNESTVLHIAVYHNRVDFVPRILARFTADQKYKLLSIRNAEGATPADLSVHTIFSTVQELKYMHGYMDIVGHDLYRLDDELRDLAEQSITNTWELEVAQNKVEELQIQKVKQQRELTKLDDKCRELEEENTRHTTELEVAQEKVTGLERELPKLDDKCRDLEEENAKHTTVIAEQENDIAEQGKAMKRMARRLQRLEKKLEIFLQIPIGTSESEEQLNEESVSSAARNG